VEALVKSASADHAGHIFISYAREDDEPPPHVPEAQGFVAHLHDYLRYELTQIGGDYPALWRDVKRIERGHQFEPYLEEALAKASLLLVVLSRNWVRREWCRRELDEFVRRFSKEEERSLRERIVVVRKNAVPVAEQPKWLQGQEGYSFFWRDPESDQELDFFVHGKIKDQRYVDRSRELARYLWHRAQQTVPPPPDPPPATPGGRAVYLSKPAGDMVEAYNTLVCELRGRGYRVLPEAAADLPTDGAAAVVLMDQQIAEAEISLHLLGKQRGFAPEGERPIVPLQLARAARRVGARISEEERDLRRFHRIIWAPRILADQQIVGGDPAQVLCSFGDCLESDQVVSDSLVGFSQFVIQHLDANAPRPSPLSAPPGDGAKIYITHLESDSAYAEILAEQLMKHGHEPWFPAFDGEESERNRLHQRYLSDCDAVVMCWANASEVWVRSHAAELKWETLHRQTPFSCRSVIAGPPPQAPKNRFRRIPPRTDVDVVIDATEHSALPPDLLAPLLERLTNHASA
jgi:TIR domain